MSNQENDLMRQLVEKISFVVNGDVLETWFVCSKCGKKFHTFGDIKKQICTNCSFGIDRSAIRDTSGQ